MESFRENAAFLFGYEKMEMILSDKRQSACPINTWMTRKSHLAKLLQIVAKTVKFVRSLQK